MRCSRCRPLAIAATALLAALPVAGAELYLAGDIGIASLSGDGSGTNDFVGLTNTGSSTDEAPVYGAALGLQFPLNAALPWRMRLPEFGIPYWPGREIHFDGGEDVRFPDWGVRFEIEHLRGRNVDLATDSFNAFEPYRSSIKSWSVMTKLRLDVPVRAPIAAMFGRVPFLDPLTLYGGAGVGLGVTDLKVGTGVLAGSDNVKGLGWQAIAGFGYTLNDRVKWSIGYRYTDLGQAKAQLFDATGTNRGRYAVDLQAHEFTTSLSFAFWRLPFLGDE
jgi:opacity protein-like surface antigen